MAEPTTSDVDTSDVDTSDVDTSDVEGLDPYALMAAETERIDRFVAGLDDAGLERPSACEGWRVRDVVAHLGASEEYNAACLADDVAAFFARLTARGATDFHAFNAAGVDERRDRPFAAVLGEWREATAATRSGLEALDGATVPTSVGPYPARWQGFHLAAELATHADDMGVPQGAAEASERAAWRARVARFLLKEAKSDLAVSVEADGTRVRGPGLAEAAGVVLSDEALVAVTQARRPPVPVAADVAAALSLMP